MLFSLSRGRPRHDESCSPPTTIIHGLFRKIFGTVFRRKLERRVFQQQKKKSQGTSTMTLFLRRYGPSTFCEFLIPERLENWKYVYIWQLGK